MADTKTPTHDLLAVIDSEDQDGKQKTKWIQLAALWEGQNGALSGELLVLPIAVLSGQAVRITVTPRARDDRRDDRRDNRGGRR